jgi:tetratricopeptide (TPR) repeat protein
MVEIDKIINERSDDRILKSLMEISDQEFYRLVETIMGYLELKITRGRPKSTFFIAECVHRTDGKKYTVFFSRGNEMIAKADIESLVAYMKKAESPNGLVFTVSKVADDAGVLAESSNVGLADGTKLSALLRRFDLDKEVIKAAELWKERMKTTVAPGLDRQLEEAMKNGYGALADKDWMRALDSFDKAIMLKEDYDVPWRLKGNALDEMGYHEQALECYKHALDLKGDSDETWFSLGNCLFSLGRYAEEIVCYDRALQFNPMMQKALINKGSTLHRLGRYKEALEAYDSVLKINYRLEKVHNNRGATLHSLGQLNEALAAYNRAIDLKRDYVEAWMNKGSLLYEQARFPEAFDAFTQMTQVRPELPKGWYLRGLAARKTNNISAAKASFEAALRLDPDYAEAKRALDDVSKKITQKFTEVPRLVQDIFSSDAARAAETPEPQRRLSDDAVARVLEEKVEELAEELYGDKGELLARLGRPEEAFEYLGKSLRLEGENPSMLTSAGNVLYRLGKLEAAAKTYEHALVADPSHVPAMFNLLIVLEEMGETDRAARVGEMMRKSEPSWQAMTAASLEAYSRGELKQAVEDVEHAITLENLATLQNYRGLVKLKAGDGSAMESFEKTKSMPLDQSEAFNNSGILLLRTGEIGGASTEFDKAIRLQRNNHAAWNNRGCILYRVDRIREAVACFEESSVMCPTAVAFTNKGFCQLSIDLLAEALRTFDQSIATMPTPEAYNNKGIVLERLGKYDEAKTAFHEAQRLAPEFKDAADNSRRMDQKGKGADMSRAGPKPPGEEVVGDKEKAAATLATLTKDSLKTMRKQEIEAISGSLGLSNDGTKSDMIKRILREKELRATK